MENWQSEFLQFSLFIAATIWLAAEGLERVEAASKTQGSRATSSSRSGATLLQTRPRLGEGRRPSHADLRELAADRDDARSSSRPGSVSRSTTGGSSTRSRRRTMRRQCPGVGICSIPTSGRRRSRTGSPSFSPWGRSSSSRSTYVSAALPSRSPSARRTTRRRRRADAGSSPVTVTAWAHDAQPQILQRRSCG